MQKLYKFYRPALAVLIFLLTLAYAPTVQADIGSWQKGFTLRLTNESKEDVTASLENAAKTGANYIAITPGYVTNNKYSSNVDRKSRTPSDEILIFAIDKSHELGMQVMLKPHVDRKDGGWRAFINPGDKYKFFKNYTAMMMHHARIAKDHNVEQLAIGAELYKLTMNRDNEHYWRQMIAEIKTVYEGKLTYSANAYSEYFDEGDLPFGDALDYWGMSMYPELATNKNPTIGELTQAWKKIDTEYIYPMYLKWNKPIIFAEMGYRSLDGAGISPEEYGSSKNVDLQEQVTLFEAFFEYWKDKTYFKGVHIWDWKPEPDAGGSKDTDYTPQNKPAEELITSYFKSKADTENTDSNNTSQENGATTTEEENTVETQETTQNALITNVHATSDKDYVTANLIKDARVYIDRSYRVISFPGLLENAVFIQTSNSDKTRSDDNFLNFDLNEDAFVYVAFDNRSTTLPGWIDSTWTKTDGTVVTEDTELVIYKKAFLAQSVTLGGNAASPMEGARSNYVVIASTKELAESTSYNNSAEEETAQTTAQTDETAQEQPIQNNEETTQEENPQAIDTQGKTLKIGYPKPDQEMSGEKKLKVYIEDIHTDFYTATYNVDNKGEEPMDYGSDSKYQQEKLDFDTWKWNGEGPYFVEFTARDLDGNIIDKTSIELYIRD